MLLQEPFRESFLPEMVLVFFSRINRLFFFFNFMICLNNQALSFLLTLSGPARMSSVSRWENGFHWTKLPISSWMPLNLSGVHLSPLVLLGAPPLCLAVDSIVPAPQSVLHELLVHQGKL